MAKVRRQLITIDEEKCDGCGNCVPSCAEGALQVVNGKARLVKESYCDGLGACLGECPQGALEVVELEADPFDEAEVMVHLGHAPAAAHGPAPALRPGSEIPLCPSVQFRTFEEPAAPLAPAGSRAARLPSELRQWPVQLALLSPQAPFLQGADLTLVADCVPFAYPNFHADLLRGSAVAVGCPKLDDPAAYVRKLAQILVTANIRSLKVAHMEVPCCSGLIFIAERALQQSGRDIPFESILVRIQE